MELEDFPEDWLWSDINKKQYCDLIEEKIDEAFPENNRGKRKLMRKLEKFKKITNREKASKYVKRLIKMIDESSIDDKVDEGRRDFLKTGLKAAGVGLGLGLGLKQGKGNTDALYDKDGKLINSADFGGSTAVKTDGTPVTMYKEGYGFGPNGEFYLRGANGGVEQAKTAADYIKAAEQIKDVNEKIKIYDNARKGIENNEVGGRPEDKAKVYDIMGTFAYEKNKFKEALIFFEAALGYQPENKDYLSAVNRLKRN